MKIAGRYLTFVLSALIAAQAVIPVFAERLPIRIYTSADGLGSSATFSLVRDAKGFIWLCSRDGLVRFDGYRFITYKIGDEKADPAIFSMLPTRGGTYWINLNRGTDYRFIPKPDDREVDALPRGDVRNDLRVPMEAVPIKDTPLPGFEDAEGNLWTSNNKGIVRMVEREDGTFDLETIEVSLPGNPKPGLTTIALAASQGPGFWIGTQWGVSRRLPDGRMFHTSIDPKEGDDTVFYYTEDKQNRLWIARPGGVAVVKTVGRADLTASATLPDRKATVSNGSVSADGTAAVPDAVDQGAFFRFEDIMRGFGPASFAAPDFFKPTVARILTGEDGKVWIATNHGLVMYDGRRFRHFTTANGLAADNITSMVEDGEGYIWLATYGGLHRLNPHGLTTFNESDGIESERIHSIYENAAGELQAVVGNFRVAAMRDGRFTMVRPAIDPNAGFFWMSNAALPDSRGDWWFTTNTSLYRYSGVSRVEDLNGRKETETLTPVTDARVTGNLRVLEDSSGNIWTSTAKTGIGWILTRRAPDGTVTQFDESKIFKGVAGVLSIVDDGSGASWFAFNEGGIARYRDGAFTKIDAEGLPDGGLTGIYRDSKGRFWVSTSREGLFRVDDPGAEKPTFHRYTIEDGLTSNNTRCVVEDLFGNIYVGTVRGINRLDLRTGKFSYFGTADGLASDFVNVAFRDHAGVLWFGTMNGLSRYEPVEQAPSTPSDVLISGLRIAGEDYSVSPVGQREVRVPDLAPEKNNVQIDFLSVKAGSSGDVFYQYKLEGADWSAPTTEATVTFANLLPGTHQFLVRVAGVEEGRPATVSFTISRPIWQQWWFLLALAVVLAVAIYMVYRYRLSQLLKLERVRTRIASDLHDDIGSSLSQIAILSEVVRQKVGENGVSEPLARIADTSREMVDSMSDIVWAINPARDRLGDLLKRMRRFATDLLEAKDIDLKFRIPQKIPNVHLDADLRRELYMVFKEAINNVARHSGAASANVGVAFQGQRLELTIADDGRGFEVDGKHATSMGGNGLINMRRRIERLGGELEFDSAPGQGTRVRIVVPLTLDGIASGVRKIFSAGGRN
jgi:signal transduction histidine kinase/ligand-binding sensor domain-containing protein